jgi:MinD superfamily P-loop ATPase
MANIVAVISDVEEVDGEERCAECDEKLQTGAVLVLVRNGRYLNPALVCESCAEEAAERF